MDIELKELFFDRPQLDIKIAYSAKVTIDKMEAGIIERLAGQSPCLFLLIGPTSDLITQAEEICRKQPQPTPIGSAGQLPFLTGYANSLVEQQISMRYEQQLQKDSLHNVLIGKTGGLYKSATNFHKPISELLLTDTGREGIEVAIRKFRKKIGPDERVLNTNIPDEIISMGLTPIQVLLRRKIKFDVEKGLGKAKGI